MTCFSSVRLTTPQRRGIEDSGKGLEFLEELQAIKDGSSRKGKHCGRIIVASHENLIERRLQGFRILGLGFDTGLMLRSLHAALGELDKIVVFADFSSPTKPRFPSFPFRARRNPYVLTVQK